MALIPSPFLHFYFLYKILLLWIKKEHLLENGIKLCAGLNRLKLGKITKLPVFFTNNT